MRNIFYFSVLISLTTNIFSMDIIGPHTKKFIKVFEQNPLSSDVDLNELLLETLAHMNVIKRSWKLNLPLPTIKIYNSFTHEFDEIKRIWDDGAAHRFADQAAKLITYNKKNLKKTWEHYHGECWWFWFEEQHHQQ